MMLGKELVMPIQESGEMYLETILVLTRKNNFVRSIDICEYMGYSKPSVSRAVGLLKEGGFVTSDADGYLSLTESGRVMAEKIYARHNVVSELLRILGVDESTAVDDACKIEHHISDETYEAIKQFVENHNKLA